MDLLNVALKPFNTEKHIYDIATDPKSKGSRREVRQIKMCNYSPIAFVNILKKTKQNLLLV